jgi:GrpB-like predicted nucleotidyltransferase (UPF0157 family)
MADTPDDPTASPTSPANPSLTAERLRAITIGEPARLNGPVHLAAYDPQWPRQFATLADGIREALGARALQLEHVGSTAVTGLAAKPILDLSLVVAASPDEARYVPDLERLGYVLRTREPDWYEHRLLKHERPSVNLHVFSQGSPEHERMVRFRDWLRTHEEDRALYERTKRALARREWVYIQDYADAKSAVIAAILGRAVAARDTG